MKRKLRRQEVAKGENNRSNGEGVTDLIDHAVPATNICDIARSGKIPYLLQKVVLRFDACSSNSEPKIVNFFLCKLEL